jgi:hypothetical protein
MATRKIMIDGYNHAADSTATVSWGGTQVFNGALTASVLEESLITTTTTQTPSYIFSWEYNNADDSQETQHALSIACTAGQIRVGNLWVEATRDVDIRNTGTGRTTEAIDGVYYYHAGHLGMYGDGSESANPERINILINGATPVTVGYTGNYNGVNFLLNAGDTLTCTGRVPLKMVAPE